MEKFNGIPMEIYRLITENPHLMHTDPAVIYQRNSSFGMHTYTKYLALFQADVLTWFYCSEIILQEPFLTSLM